MEEGLAWQRGVWDRMSARYLREIDMRFVPVVDGCITRAGLRPGESVLDLGTGTGAVAVRAAAAVGPSGSVVAIDVSEEMLALARQRVSTAALTNVDLREGGAEQIPAPDGQFDAVIASLSLMYAVDRSSAAVECARVLRRGGRLVAAVWGGPGDADIVRFQQTAGAFAPPPPVPGVGPGALAEPAGFVEELGGAGIEARVESETTQFDFATFEQAWDTLAGVTTANLDADRRAEAQRAVQDAMWPDPSAPRTFVNLTHFLVGRRV